MTVENITSSVLKSTNKLRHTTNTRQARYKLINNRSDFIETLWVTHLNRDSLHWTFVNVPYC